VTPSEDESRDRRRIEGVLRMDDVGLSDECTKRADADARRREWVRHAEALSQEAARRDPNDSDRPILLLDRRTPRPACGDHHLVSSRGQPLRQDLDEPLDAPDAGSEVRADEEDAHGATRGLQR
jgi:hypothetical protein